MNQFNVSFKDGGLGQKGDWLIWGGVILVGALAIAGLVWGVYTIYQQTQPQNAGGFARHFQCTKCNAEFAIPADKYAIWLRKNSTPGAFGHADCPKCGASLGGREMLMCGKCDQYFLPAAGSAVKTSDGIVCPKCQAKKESAPAAAGAPTP